MSRQELVGLQEIASIAGFTASAVANWRKRFPDFPAPLVELKSGPVFDKADVVTWLDRREGRDLVRSSQFYEQLAGKRGDDSELAAAVNDTVSKLEHEATSTRKPGILLGKIQSGKTRAYLGIIAKAFDVGYDAAIILTKGTTSLAQQTLSRVKDDFAEFIDADKIQVHDIMSLPDLTPYELGQKVVLIVKKEDDNLRRLLTAFEETYPTLQTKRVLIIDDEADMASVAFRRKEGVVLQGTVSAQIDQLREIVKKSSLLQVTATPYSLYLQPEDEVALPGGLVKPKRPKFTVVLPTHSGYVGGDYYFERSTDSTSPAYYFYREVPLDEREALKKEDRRRIKIENILSEPRAAVLRDAIMTFIVGGCVRRIHAKERKQTLDKYSFLFHTEQTRGAHEWQEDVATAIGNGFVAEATEDSPRYNEMLSRAYADLARSVTLEGSTMPSLTHIKAEVSNSLLQGQVMITRVNSDNDVRKLLDANGQLKLRTPFNIFIGGQILDRGLTIHNLIGFYYGRNPQKAQQDTVLQHSRMYGVRSLADLSVTRFYAPLHVYQVMRKINALDAALREAFESGQHDRGVYFIQKDAQDRVIPCSPNKILLSNVVSIRPGRRMLPMGFQTLAKTVGARSLQKLDAELESLTTIGGPPELITVEKAIELLELAYSNFEFEMESDDDRNAHAAALEHLSRTSSTKTLKDKVWLITAGNRNVARYREEGRLSNAPDTKQQADAATQIATDIPVLMLLRQNGDVEKGWRGLPFWWPVLVTPNNAVTSIFTVGANAS